MESESMSESGKIYRNSNGNYCFICVHCGSYFESINDTLEHIESHFTDGTIIASDESFLNENKPLGCVDSLEFVSITSDTR